MCCGSLRVQPKNTEWKMKQILLSLFSKVDSSRHSRSCLLGVAFSNFNGLGFGFFRFNIRLFPTIINRSRFKRLRPSPAPEQIGIVHIRPPVNERAKQDRSSSSKNPRSHLCQLISSMPQSLHSKDVVQLLKRHRIDLALFGIYHCTRCFRNKEETQNHGYSVQSRKCAEENQLCMLITGIFDRITDLNEGNNQREDAWRFLSAFTSTIVWSTYLNLPDLRRLRIQRQSRGILRERLPMRM